MRWFSGFKFHNDIELFRQFLNPSQFTVAGFSYGAILAFEYVLNSRERVDTLQLFSPAFFKDRDKKFIRTQLLHFKKNEERYIENFLKNAFYPREVPKEFQAGKGDYSDLEKLLNFQWEKEKLEEVKNRGVRLEIFLGELDKIINSKEAWDFFKEFGTVLYIKGVGHCLLSN